jgi:pimeloyl-ACP methyl ester carboxylesterase
VYYGDFYLQSPGSKGGSGLENLSSLDEDMFEFLSEVQDELAQDVSPEQLKGFKELPRPLAKLAGWLDRKFDATQTVMFFGDLIQVPRFQRDADLRASVVERAREVLTDEPRVLVGHSLGSVVAHHVLHEVRDHGVETLITLGSPLGLSSVRRRLCHEQTFPPGVRASTNVYDLSDAVACAGALRASRACASNISRWWRQQSPVGVAATACAIAATQAFGSSGSRSSR